MQNIVDALNYLKSVIDIELSLRQASNVEWSNGIHDGPMKKAHDESIKQVVEAARQLIAIA